MKKRNYYFAALIPLMALSILAADCVRSTRFAPTTVNAAAPTPTSTPQVFTLTIQSGTLGTYSGYYYSCTSGTNDTAAGTYSMTVHVNDVANMPAASFHPLYVNIGGQTTCVMNFQGETNASQPLTFTTTGIYYIHCGFHAANCTTTSCSATSCTALAGQITVIP